MNEQEALTRVKTGNFNSGRGFDMQLLVDAVGIIGEMLKSGQLSKVVRCKNCKRIQRDGWCKFYRHSGKEDWYCADGGERL